MTTTHAPAYADRLAEELLNLENGDLPSHPPDVAAAQRVEREATLLDRADLVLRARLVGATAMLRDGETVAGGRIVHQVHREAAGLGDDYLLARCHRAMSIFFRQLGDNATGLEHAVQCMSHTSEDVPSPLRARHLMCLAVLLDETGSQEEAVRVFEEALVIAAANRDGRLAIKLLNNIAYSAYERGDLQAAEDIEQQLWATSESTGEPLTGTVLDTLARLAMLAGRHADVEAILAPVLADDAPPQLLDDGGDTIEEALLTAAEAQRELGDIARAQELLDRALLLCAEHDLAGQQARAREQQALVYAAAGRYQEAFEEYRRFHAETQVLTSAEQDARSRALQAVYEAEQARRATDEFRELAHRDALTGLHNRRHVDEELPAALEAVATAGPVSVALIDLDHFKRINDTLSHATGDVVLRRFAGLLTDAAPGDAVVARLGGEEFVVVLPGADEAAAWIAAERIRMAVAGHDWTPVTRELPVTCSIGITTVTGPGPTAGAVLAAADRNLYAAKRSGRDRVCGDRVSRP
ncbi:diguanylate cyclase [Amorphoplanes digitatis]|uniref:Diguanylate cyclase (GGDEF)-like protein n=1 Tax=Actinoplanes digitatis TaxID=1868 RepID=A0A7W7HZ62_9ACTN|nr:diguanylate cyclase [Actinoplanes digitatis]MBB4763479.1 diguanylate cyclase (GGDEF)-like protein [Actinoplanes digitatis]GID92296.1 hypothetical protein Adi01nite_17080 [Actinoplanes digitatis]